VKLAPTDAKLWYNLGLTYARMGQLDAARETIEKTIEMKPDYERARYAHALILVDVGEKDKAIEEVEYILQNINPDSGLAKEFIEEYK
jgi:tetratricopeptide (TPR) repeat protein